MNHFLLHTTTTNDEVYNIVSASISAIFRIFTDAPDQAQVTIVRMINPGKYFKHPANNNPTLFRTHAPPLVAKIEDVTKQPQSPMGPTLGAPVAALESQHYKLVVSFPPGFQPEKNNDYLPKDYHYRNKASGYQYIAVDDRALYDYFTQNVVDQLINN